MKMKKILQTLRESSSLNQAEVQSHIGFAFYLLRVTDYGCLEIKQSWFSDKVYVCHGICVEVRKVSLFKTLEIHRLLSYCNYASLFCILRLIDVYKINLCKNNTGRMYGVLLYVSNIVPFQMSVITICHCHTPSWTEVLFFEQFFYVLIHIKNPTRCKSVSKFISYKYEINFDTLLHLVGFLF